MKKIILVTFVFFIYSGTVHSATDCSGVKKLSKEYLSCITKKAKNKSSSLGGVELDATNLKEKKYLSDWFKKKK